MHAAFWGEEATQVREPHGNAVSVIIEEECAAATHGSKLWHVVGESAAVWSQGVPYTAALNSCSSGGLQVPVAGVFLFGVSK